MKSAIAGTAHPISKGVDCFAVLFHSRCQDLTPSTLHQRHTECSTYPFRASAGRLSLAAHYLRRRGKITSSPALAVHVSRGHKHRAGGLSDCPKLSEELYYSPRLEERCSLIRELRDTEDQLIRERPGPSRLVLGSASGSGLRMHWFRCKGFGAARKVLRYHHTVKPTQNPASRSMTQLQNATKPQLSRLSLRIPHKQPKAYTRGTSLERLRKLPSTCSSLMRLDRMGVPRQLGQFEVL